jgi:hypothetical protein
VSCYVIQLSNSLSHPGPAKFDIKHQSISIILLQARRSMVFAKHLRDLGDTFRKEFLDSTDEADKTILDDWTKMKVYI